MTSKLKFFYTVVYSSLKVASKPQPAHIHRLDPTDLDACKIPAGERKIPEPIMVPTTKDIPPKIPTLDYNKSCLD